MGILFHLFSVLERHYGWKVTLVIEEIEPQYTIFARLRYWSNGLVSEISEISFNL